MKKRPKHRALLSILGATLIGCGSTASDGLECGEGTVEESGACVVAEGDTDGGSSSSSGSVDSGFTSASESDSAGTGDSAATATAGKADDDDAPYAACPGGSDVECLDFEGCHDDLGMCTRSCGSDNDCPSPAGGTAVQRCERTGRFSGMCVIYCGAEGFECPSGMTCREESLCDADEGGTTGGWGTTGGGCENPSLEICVWD